MKTLKEINERMAQIAEEIRKEDADIDALTKEVDELEEEKRTVIKNAEIRKATLERIANSNSNEIIERGKEKEEMEERKENGLDSEVYRSAYFKRLLGKELTAEEERAFAVSGVEGALPVQTSEEIIKKLSQYAPMLDEITLLHVPGQVKFAVEGTKTSASGHTENAKITGDSDTLVTVSLGGYEVTKLIQVSKSVEKMTVASFESWLIDMITEMVGDKIEDLIFNGTGTSQAKGINKITYSTDKNNVVQVAKDTAITADNIRSLIALLPGGYDKGAKMYMRKATLFNRIMGLQDNAKHDLVREVNGVYYVYGYEVKLSDKAPENEVIFGNAKKYVGNLAEEINVTKQFDIDTNSNKYLGCAMFDGKPAIEEAFVKLVQLTA